MTGTALTRRCGALLLASASLATIAHAQRPSASRASIEPRNACATTSRSTVYALKAMQSVGALRDASITVVMTGDDEAAGDPLAVARAPLIDAARASDIPTSRSAPA